MSIATEQEHPQSIWLCRHGNRIDFVDPSWRGLDPHLSPDGIVQARETGLRLKREGIRHIFASPFLRTVETAHYIAETLDTSVRIEYGASEWLNRDWFPEAPTHIPVPELRQRFPRIDGTYRSVVIPSYPESAEEAFLRAGNTACLLADRVKDPFLIVGHGASVEGMTRGLMGRECAITGGLCALVKINRRNGHSTLELDGDVSHLSGGESHADRLV